MVNLEAGFDSAWLVGQRYFVAMLPGHHIAGTLCLIIPLLSNVKIDQWVQ